jgi:aldehyde:ferredoxin oxidoreductase
MAAGTTAKILHVDLSTRESRAEMLPETVVRAYLGGGALASYILLCDMRAGVDPLGPDNVLVFTTSVINGLSPSGTNRYTAAAKEAAAGQK